MRRLFCDLGLHVWNRYDIVCDWLVCAFCPEKLSAETMWRRSGYDPARR